MTGRTRSALMVAAAAVVLTLGLPVTGGSIGRTDSIRVFLVAALVLIALAASSAPRRAHRLLGGAVAMVGTSIALTIGDAAPQGLVIMLIAIAALVWARREQVEHARG